MGQVTIHNLKSVPPGLVQLCAVNVGEAVFFPNAIQVHQGNPRVVEPGVYIRTKVNVSGFAQRNSQWETFLNLQTGETKFLPGWIFAESIDLSVHFKRTK